MGSEMHVLWPLNGTSSKLVATQALRAASNLVTSKREWGHSSPSH